MVLAMETNLLTLPWVDVLALGAAVYLMSSYLVAAAVFRWPRQKLTLWLQTREAKLYGKANADGVTQRAAEVWEARARYYAFALQGLRCRVCVGQWASFVAYSWADSWSAPWSWGFAGWFTALVINAAPTLVLETIGKANQ